MIVVMVCFLNNGSYSSSSQEITQHVIIILTLAGRLENY